MKVDGTAYTFLGDPGVPNTNSQLAVQKSAQVPLSSTLSILRDMTVKRFSVYSYTEHICHDRRTGGSYSDIPKSYRGMFRRIVSASIFGR